MYGYATTTSLKYFKTLKIYKNSTGTCVLNPAKKTAYSYTHWCFLKKINGKLVFNNYSYSVSTSAHQSTVSDVLEQLKIKVDFTVYQRESLDKGIKVDAIIHALELAKYRLTKKGLQTRSKERLNREVKARELELKKLRQKLGVSVPRKLLAEIKERVVREETQRLAYAAQRREKRAPLEADLKKKLASLAGVDLLNKMNDSDDLGLIKF